MKKPIDGKRQPILWAGMRQLESVLEALKCTLIGHALPSEFRENPRRWLREQGAEVPDEAPSGGLFSRAISDGFERLFGTPLGCYVLAREAPEAT